MKVEGLKYLHEFFDGIPVYFNSRNKMSIYALTDSEPRGQPSSNNASRKRILPRGIFI